MNLSGRENQDLNMFYLPLIYKITLLLISTFFFMAQFSPPHMKLIYLQRPPGWEMLSSYTFGYSLFLPCFKSKWMWNPSLSFSSDGLAQLLLPKLWSSLKNADSHYAPWKLTGLFRTESNSKTVQAVLVLDWIWISLPSINLKEFWKKKVYHCVRVHLIYSRKCYLEWQLWVHRTYLCYLITRL